jgi:hypothetical protein
MDYKFFCFDGKVELLYVASERQKKDETTKFDFFDAEFIHLPVQQKGHPNALITPSKPVHFDEMKQLAEKLSKNIPHVRLDFYECGDMVLFGEMTFYSMSGMCPYTPLEWDYRIGKYLKLS